MTRFADMSTKERWNKNETAVKHNTWVEQLSTEDQLELNNSDEIIESAPTEATYNRDEVIELCQNSLNFLAAMAMPETFKFLFPDTYLTIWELLTSSVVKKKEFPKLALGIPRGHAKTTMTKLFILWCILFSDLSFTLVLAETSDKAEEIIDDVAGMLNQSNIKQTFGDWKAGLIKDTQEIKIFGYRRRTIVLATKGAEGAVRGKNIKNMRPDLMIFEDIQSRECADSEDQSSKLLRWMVGTAMKAKSPSGCVFIFVGNMYPTQHSILKKLKLMPTWLKFISGAILADGTALWEELRSLDSLIEEFDGDIELGHPEIFFSEVLNDTNVGANNSVDFSKFGDWRWEENDYPQGKFIVIDPSQGKKKDADCIGYFEVYDEIVGFREAVTGQFSPGQLIKTAIILALRRGVRLIAVESFAYQYTLLYWFEEVCKSVGITGLSFVPVYNMGNSSKNSRITNGIKALQAKEIILHPEVKNVIQNEILNWNRLKKDNVDDHLDLLAYAPRILSDHTYDILTPEAPISQESSGARVEENNHCF
ncbi:unnamed protein product [Sphagnum tenellum]